jgi:putative transposon-encoded protein
MTAKGMKQHTEREITKVAAYATPFGTGAHIVLPKEWLRKRIIAVTKDRWALLNKTKGEDYQYKNG